MPKAILLIHPEAKKAKLLTDSLLDSLDGLFIVEWVGSCADGIRRLRERTLDRVSAILLSINLPDSPGLEAFDAISKIAPNIPILVLSSVTCEERAKRAV